MTVKSTLTIGFVFVLLAVTTPVVASQNDVIEFEGLIEPFELVNVGTPVEGVVENVKVRRSSQVKKGEPLVFLESSVESTVVERAKDKARDESNYYTGN